jgi:hypothetical protein
VPPFFNNIYDILDFNTQDEKEIKERSSTRISNRYGKIGNISKIVFQKNKSIQITIPKHNLTNKDTIYIKNTNSFPIIDNFYEKITIIDENSSK